MTTATVAAYRQVICRGCYVSSGVRTVLGARQETGVFTVVDKKHRYDFNPVKGEVIILCYSCNQETVERRQL